MFVISSLKCLLVQVVLLLFAVGECVSGDSEGVALFARAGDSLNLTCPIEPPVAWYKDNTPISPNDVAFRQFLDGKILNFGSSLGADQAGWYTCAGYMNSFSGKEERDFLVVVGGMSKIYCFGQVFLEAVASFHPESF